LTSRRRFFKTDSAEKPIPVSQREKGMESKKLGG
jgi:hypothetical protein